MKLTDSQYNYLHGFYVHSYVATHETKEPLDSQFWSNILDELKIPWSIQNAVFCLAEKRESRFYYFRSQLANIIKELGLVQELVSNEKSNSIDK